MATLRISTVLLSTTLIYVLSILLVGQASQVSLRKTPFATTGASSRHIPFFRPIKRVIKNFYHERTAFVTIVFQRSVMPKMRWFRTVRNNNLSNAEIPYMISIEGDRQYHIRSISSYDVTAVTLSIIGLRDAFPVKLTTCFSVDGLPFQYQLDTVVDEPIDLRIEPLDGILWRHTPPPVIMFSTEGILPVVCEVQLDSESPRFTDELNIYRNFIDNKRKGLNQQMSSNGCGKMHKDRDNYTEDAGKYKYKGRRTVLSGRSGARPVVLQVSFEVFNGSQDDMGVYTCATERARDRTYISSWVKQLPPARPVMIFLPCEDGPVGTQPQLDRDQPYNLKLVVGRPSCVRCRAYGHVIRSSSNSATGGTSDEIHPPVPITLSKGGEIVVGTSSDGGSILQDFHLNVADGGLYELTVTFVKPSRADQGLYKCHIKNPNGEDEVQFKVAVVTENAG